MENETPCSLLVLYGIDSSMTVESITLAIDFALGFAGSVRDVSIARDKSTMQPRGFCFVEFFVMEVGRQSHGSSSGLPVDCS